MQDSNESLKNSSSKTPRRILVIVISAIALIGFYDATYLTVKHFQNLTPNCSILEGCDVVTTSVYSKIAGIPVALLGSIYYASILALVIAYVDTKKKLFLKMLAHLTWAGLIASAWFVYLQLVVIGAICLYCMGSAVSSTLLFLLRFPLLKYLDT